MQEGRQKAGETQGVDGLVEGNTPLKRLVMERDLQIALLTPRCAGKTGLQVATLPHAS
ncbi:MAG: hypothetical protein M1499_05055 [Firmicutes bacterium]|jgi:hypothetical protein|nr:hypothetical protein [Bacillota bacterium]